MSSSGISVTSYDYSPSRNVKQDQTRPYRGDSARLPQLSTSPAGVQSQALCSPKITIHTVDSLLKELTFIVATRKSDQYGASVSILDRYTSDTVPTYLLRSDNFLVRRLAAVLFAFVFQANNDVFKDKSEDPRENVCMLQNFLFLNPYKSAMKHFQPEMLHCVSKPILYYLPKAQFPTGLPSFLDVDKLYSILVTKEYLRIPDPSETVIWLPYEYNMDNQLEITQQSLLRSISHSSDEESESQAARISVRGNNQGSEGAKPRGRETTHELPAKQPTDQSLRAMFKVKSKINQKQEEAEEAVPPTAEHRIKCFQFFKKVPQDTKSISPTKSNIQGTQRFRIQSIDQLKVRSASSASTTKFQGTISALKTETGLPKSRRSLMTNSAEVKPRMAAADREIRDWVTGRDYSYYTSTTQTAVPEDLESIQRRGLTPGVSPTKSAPFKIKPRTTLNSEQQQAKVHSNIRTALQLKQMLSEITKTIGIDKKESIPEQESMRELTEVVEIEHDLDFSSSKSGLDSSADNSHPVPSLAVSSANTDSCRVSSKNGFGSKRNQIALTRSAWKDSTKQTESENMSTTIFESRSKPSFCTPPTAPRKIPLTSVDRLAVRANLKILSGKAPVSLTECGEPLENKRGKLRSRSPKIVFLKPENDHPDTPIIAPELAIADLQPISRMRNGAFLRLVPTGASSVAELQEAHKLPQRSERDGRSTAARDSHYSASKSGSTDTKKEFRVSVGKTAPYSLMVPQQSATLAQPARRTSIESKSRKQPTPVDVRPVMFVKKESRMK